MKKRTSKSERPHPDDGGHLEMVSRELKRVTDGLEYAVRRLQSFPPETDEVVTAALARRLWVFGSSMCDVMRYRMPPADSDSFEHTAALGSLARGMQDAFVLFFYFIGEPVGPEERSFRHLLFRRHELQSYIKLLTADNPVLGETPAEAINRLRSSQDQLHIEILAHPAFTTRTGATQRRIQQERGVSIFEPREDITARAGVPEAAHRFRFILGSQMVHSTPFSVAWEAEMLDSREGKIGRWVQSFLEWAIDLQERAANHLDRRLPTTTSSPQDDRSP